MALILKKATGPVFKGGVDLREELWCKIASPYKLLIHFGWDYYMYIGSKKELPIQTVSQIEKLGLFVELINKSPYS